MKKTLAAVGLLLLLVAVLVVAGPAGGADDPTRLFSQPSVPSSEALDRLNLKLAWSAYVPMDGRRDGFVSIEVNNGQLIAQTRSGLTTVLDGDTGRALWRARPGRSYKQSVRPAFNNLTVFSSDGLTIYAIDRGTGSLEWQFPVSTALATDPVADDQKLYICNMVARVIGLNLPTAALKGTPPPPAPAGDMKEGEKKPERPAGAAPYAPPPTAEPAGPQPTISWDFNSSVRLDYAPLQSQGALLIVNPEGLFQGLDKAPKDLIPNERFHASAGHPLTAPPAQSEDVAFLGKDDGRVYAVVISSGRVIWRYTSGTNLIRKPFAVQVVDGDKTERDLYVTAEDKGLSRLNQDTGEPLWNIRKNDFNPDGDRVLAVNPKFVYATDRSGRLLVLDRKSGAQLSRFDLRDFVFPVANADNDRVFLASNDGLIVCLYDKDYTTPLVYGKGGGKAPGQKSLEERVAELKAKLAKPVSDPGGDALSLDDYLTRLKTQQGVKVQVMEKTFKDMGLPPAGAAPVKTPKADNVPLGQVLQQVLDQINASYRQVEDVIVIGPKGK
jgi:outer membrane protein assembly factor BamB